MVVASGPSVSVVWPVDAEDTHRYIDICRIEVSMFVEVVTSTK
jgi:hypothetical protein